MGKLIITVGFPGSGKSTWAKKYAAMNDFTVILNADSIREMLFGTYKYDPAIEPVVKKAIHFSATALLHQGYSVIIDETNLTAQKRRVWIDLASQQAINQNYPVSVKIVWFTETEDNLDNRMKEPRGISREKWAEVIDGMKKTFEEPSPLEFNDSGMLSDIQRVSIRERDDGWIGVDLDGTLAFYDGWKGEDVIGDPIPLMVGRVRMWLAAGQRVKIMTARAGTPAGVAAVEKWLEKNGLMGIEVTDRKDFKMIELYDDRAFRVEQNTGIVRK